MEQGRQITIAVVQMKCSLKDKEANIQKAGQFLARLRTPQIVCFPELFTTGYNLDELAEDLYALGEPIPGPTTERMRDWARRHSKVILGNIVEREGVKGEVLYDTTFVISATGRLIGKYRKTHLYPTERHHFRPGHELPVFQLAGLKVATATCYDLAFPELFRTLALRGAEIVFLPSATPRGYEYLLDVRTVARAQDNQVFVAVANHVGYEGQVEYCGLSLIANPRGEMIAQASPHAEEIITARLDLSLIAQERAQEQIFENLRLELYQGLE
jgi:predicted amidohydrolase